MVLVWGIRKDGNEEQKRRADWLFQQMEDDDAQIIIPAVALSEYLTPVHPQKQRDVIARLQERFIIHPFDVRCAELAARLFSHGRTLVRAGAKGERVCLRADAMIVATAAVYGASVLYSGDKKCRKLEQFVPRLEIKDLPEIPPNLWSYPEQT